MSENSIEENLKKCAESNNLFWSKLLAPIIEIENRSTRFVVYLFGKQVLNLSVPYLKYLYYSLFYNFNLWKLRLVGRFRKIRVGFWVTEAEKWTSQYFYDELKKDSRFEPFIFLGYFSRQQGVIPPQEYFNNTKEFFEKNGCRVVETFKPEDFTFKDLKSFKPDIIFYQQPWMMPDEQRPHKNYKYSLLCYIPYCFYSMNSYLNYLAKYHAIMWKYFVETAGHKTEYEKKYNAKNCVVSGSTKLDGYHYLDKSKVSEFRSSGKKRIIYAPHHSFNDNFHEVATFKENGRFILELAKSHPETEWIFRPHPVFVDRVVKNSVMTEDEINRYYDEWKKIGTISEGGNYYEMFLSSDLLITDCISFLAEYAPTLKPVFHLRKDFQKDEFNELVKEIDKSYYQIYSNDELEKLFNQVITDNDDYLAEARKNNTNLLSANSLASENIYKYIKKELWI